MFNRIQMIIRYFWVGTLQKLVLARLRRAASHRPLKVVFLVSEVEKWKCQRVYDALMASSGFKPVVALYNLTRLAKVSLKEQREAMATKIAYMRGLGVEVVDIQKLGTPHVKSMSELGVDILIYQQPWDLPKELRPWVVARRALTFYIPYFVTTAWRPEMHTRHKLYHTLFGYVVQDETLARAYMDIARQHRFSYTSRFLPFGHPTLDHVCRLERQPPEDLVIYAPHWSIAYGKSVPPIKMSTFMETGMEILRYAQSHPEIKWVFKPHPNLARQLKESGAMSEAEIEAYYSAWMVLGCVSTGGQDEYLRLFASAKVMITDCDSFLAEFGYTGKPIVRLISKDDSSVPLPSLRDLYAAYYNVYRVADLTPTLDDVVVRGMDVKCDARLAALSKLRSLKEDCASRLSCYLTDLLFCGGKRQDEQV